MDAEMNAGNINMWCKNQEWKVDCIKENSFILNCKTCFVFILQNQLLIYILSSANSVL